MSTKDIVMLILILFGLLLALLVAQGQVNFAKLIETWEYEHVPQFNSPQIEIIWPRSFSYVPVLYNQTTHLYEFYILIQSDRLLYNYTPPITTSFPLHSLPITILFKTTEKDGHTYYIYKVILKTDELNQYGDTITIQSNNFYQEVFFYPYVVNQNQLGSSGSSGSSGSGGQSGGSSNNNSSNSNSIGSNSSSNSSNQTNSTNNTVSNQTNNNSTITNNNSSVNNSTINNSTPNSNQTISNQTSNNSTTNNSSSGGGSGSSNNTLTNNSTLTSNSTLLSNVTITDSNTTFTNGTSYDNYVSGVWENSTVINYNSTNSSTQNLVKGNYINPPNATNIERIVLAPYQSMTLENNNQYFAVTSLYAIDTISNSYRLFAVSDAYNNYHILALHENYLQQNNIVAIRQTTSYINSYIVIYYDIFYYNPVKIVRIGYVLQNNTFEAVKEIELQGTLAGQNITLVLKDVITTPYYYILVINSNVLLYLNRQTLQIAKVKQLNAIPNTQSLVFSLYETNYQQKIAVSSLSTLALFNKSTSGTYDMKVFGSAGGTIQQLLPAPAGTGYVVFKQGNTIFVDYTNSSGHYITDFKTAYTGQGYALHVKILNKNWKPLWPAGFNSEHVGGSWTALTFYNNQTQEFSPVFLLFNPGTGETYACEYNNVLSFSQGQGYLFNVLYNLITVTLFNQFENLIYSSGSALNVIYNTLFFTCRNVDNSVVDLSDLSGSNADVYVQVLPISQVSAFKVSSTYQNINLANYLVNSTVSITEQAESFYLYTVDNNVIYPISYYSPLTNGG